MDRSAIITGIKAALGEVLMQQVTDVSEKTMLFEELYMDSTTILELLMAMEDTLGLEIDTENLNLDTFKTIGTLADYVGATLQPDNDSVRS